MNDKIEVLQDGSLIFHCLGCGSSHRVEVQPHKSTGWTWNGDRKKPTISPSILSFAPLKNGQKKTLCHLFVRDGKLEFCNDSPHESAGKTVDMECIGDEQ